ncbi:MAG: hypothetical protein R6U43_11675 [Candidatus Krumholzibacteriales bacterium]
MKKLFFTLLIGALVFSMGCETDDKVMTPVDKTTGAMVLRIDRENAPTSVVSVEATLTRSGFETISAEMDLLSDSAAELTLNDIPPGVWHLKVDAKNQEGVVEYTGETEVTVIEGMITDISLVLYPVSDGTGGIYLFVTWGEEMPFFLIIDEDGLDNGLYYNSAGGPITPDGPDFFSEQDVNDDMSDETQRQVLRYFQSNTGRTITVMTGQTGDEGWFAPNCIPAKWICGYGYEDNTCLDGLEMQKAVRNYFGINGTDSIPSQERLDKIPDVRPLRALGINRLIGRIVVAVVYDSDVSINYDFDSPLGVNGNLQGETLGIVAFRVEEARTLNDFSDSTLPEVVITILDVSMYRNAPLKLLGAPIPASSSVPNDRYPPGSPDGYHSLGY